MLIIFNIIVINFTAIDDEIIQIAAAQSKDSIFNCYVWPKQGCIPSKVSRITGIEIHGNKMFYNSIEVIYTNLNQALKELFNQFAGMTLCAHNATFDAPMLTIACQQCGIDIASKGLTFCNTLPMFKEALPNQRSYSQENLVRNIIKKDYEAHNAVADVLTLLELYSEVPTAVRENTKYFFSVLSVKDSILNSSNKKKCIGAYKFLTEDKTLSDYMASKLASAGISVEYLQHIANEKSVDGLNSLLRPFCQKKIAESIYLKILKKSDVNINYQGKQVI